ncbi:MAG: hypothetical protein PPP58_07830 [Natronomonas sp.]
MSRDTIGTDDRFGIGRSEVDSSIESVGTNEWIGTHSYEAYTVTQEYAIVDHERRHGEELVRETRYEHDDDGVYDEYTISWAVSKGHEGMVVDFNATNVESFVQSTFMDDPVSMIEDAIIEREME